MASHIELKEFKKYEPLYTGVRSQSRLAMLGNIMLNMRRLTMLFMAMFVIKLQWLQLQLFILLNFVSLAYIVVVSPFDRTQLNALNGFNEIFGLLIAYLLLLMQDLRMGPEQRYEVGEAIVVIIKAAALVNLLIVVARSAYDF